MTNLTASQIAAQAAMQHQSLNQHSRKRSQTVPSPQPLPETAGGRRKPPPLQHTTDIPKKPTSHSSPVHQQYHNGLLGGHTAAATAANAAFPRSTPLSPGLTTFETPAVEKEHKLKTERSKIKLFSKPKQIGLSNSKEVDPKDRPMPSPNRIGLGPSSLSKMVNPSTTSLASSTVSGAPSIYTSNNASTSTLIPPDRPVTQEKEKAHKHHFLSRQKNKLKDKIVDDYSLTLSSASSNSKPIDPNAPQSLYSFAPASPGPNSTSFAKSVSGLDLRHGGRALREKKKEEKASGLLPGFESKRPDIERNDWALSTSLASSAAHSFSEPVSSSNVSAFAGLSSVYNGDIMTPQAGLQGFGLSNMSPEEAWDFLKAKLLIIFEGEELRMPVEDLNRLVSVNIQRCILKQVPNVIIDDLRDLLQTGFSSLNQTLRGISDHRLIPALVDCVAPRFWQNTFLHAGCVPPA